MYNLRTEIQKKQKSINDEIMKILRCIPYFLIISMLFIPMVSTVKAAAKPDYVGLDVNDVIIWRVTIDDDPYEDYLEDYGFST